MLRSIDSRIYVIQFLLALAFSAVISRLFFIQVLRNKEYSSKARDQHESMRVVEARRGDILASDLFPLATTKISYLLFAEANKIEDKAAYAKSLAPTLVDKDKINETVSNSLQSTRLNSSDLFKAIELKEISDTEKRILTYLQENKSWVMIKRGLSRAEKEVIEKLNLKYLGIEDERQRSYPEKLLASHVLGFVAGSDSGESQGYFGLEGYFNGDLRGKAGRVYEEVGANGHIILLGGFREIPSQNGRTLVTTIRRDVQFSVEKLLKEGVEKYKAKTGSVLILNPTNGDIVALANYPTYDPSHLSDNAKEASVEAKNLKRNLVITDIYEPGSVIKPLTIASAIELGFIDESSTFNDDGPKIYSGYTIDNWNGKHLGVQNIRELLQKSNNIGASWVGVKIGSKDLYRYFRKFGLGEYTGVELEGENAGVLRNAKDWRDIDLATAAFGQGISVSIIQLASAFAVFDNGGKLIKPRIVNSILDGERKIEIPTEVKRVVISAKTVEKMRNLLISAVDAGESKYFNVKNYTVAGKTGTAQIPVDGKYDLNKTNVTFIGFLPYLEDSKKFVMIVKLEEPTTSIYAAETAVPLWMAMLKEVVKIYKILPDR